VGVSHPRNLTQKGVLFGVQLVYKATGATERIIQSRDGKTVQLPEEIQKFHSIMLSITNEVRLCGLLIVTAYQDGKFLAEVSTSHNSS
jgi:hypothetical protein